MKKSISLLLLATLISACSNSNKYKELEGTSSKINIDYSKKDYKDLNKDLQENSVFLAGELHGIQENYILRLNLLMYLNENAGVNYYLAEMGYSSSYFLNKYLKTGEEKYLFVVANSIVGSYDYSLDDVNFWRNLYKYNQSIPKNKRIKVVGIDIEHQFWLAVMQINDLLEDLNLGDSMEPTLGKLEYFSATVCPDSKNTKDILKNVRKVNPKEILEVVSEIKADLNNNPLKYKNLLSSDDYEDLSYVLNNITNTERIYSNRNNRDFFNKEREKAIYNNFLKVYSMHDHSKFFGQWGSFHIMQKSDNDENRFAQYLNGNNSPVKDKVISIKYIYDNPYHMRTNRKMLSAFKKYGDSKFTLYNLDPLKCETSEVCPINDYGITDVNEFFQYGILIRNPKKVTPISG